jgi:hypothetical protein
MGKKSLLVAFYAPVIIDVIFASEQCDFSFTCRFQSMKKLSRLGALLALSTTAPAIFLPLLVPASEAQDRPQFQDVPAGHWAYTAIQQLARAGILEGYSTDEYRGPKNLTRYEFAVAIARILDKRMLYMPASPPDVITPRLNALEARPIPEVTRAQINDLIAALRREFADEIARLNNRVLVLDNRVMRIENKVTPPPRLTVASSFLHRTGAANYINNKTAGRNFLNPVLLRPNPVGINPFLPIDPPPFQVGNQIIDLPLINPIPAFQSNNGNFSDNKFSYSDFRLRLSNRVSDRLSLSADLVSLGSTQEDPWVGDSKGGFYLREAFASADLGGKTGALKNFSLSLGRQRTRVAQGLLYDNDLSPTDQISVDGKIGPVNLSAFVGTTNNQKGVGSFSDFNGDPYVTQGAVFYLNSGIVGNDRATGFPGFGVGVINGNLPPTPDNLDLDTDFDANSFAIPNAEDHESLARASVNLFKLGGAPVQLGYNRLFDGFRSQRGDSFDLNVPLFGRNVGVEYVRQTETAFGADPVGSPHAFIASVPLLKTSLLDLNLAYGKASDNFVYNVISAANPYARTYGEALFDRPLALGAPMMTTLNGGGFLAAKQTFDVKGRLTLPFLKSAPLDFRYYTAKSGANLPISGVGIINGGNRVNLGAVYSLGTTFSLSPGLDLEFMGGIYNPKGNLSNLRYLRVGASYGF